MKKEKLTADQIIDRAVRDQTIANLKRREAEIQDNLDFASRLLAGEFDEPDDETPDDSNAGAPDVDEGDDYDDWLYDNVRLFETEADDDATEDDDDVWYYEETEGMEWE